MHLRSKLVGPQGFVVALRLGLYLLLCTVLLLLGGHVNWSLTMLALTGIVAVATVGTLYSSARVGPAIEIGAAALVIGLSEPHGSALLPYLLAPAVESGLLWGAGAAVSTVGIGAVVLGTTAVAAGPDPRTFAAYTSQWLVLALVAGLLAAWARRLSEQSPSESDQASYESAYRLLSQLRAVSRQLAGGLDVYSLAQATLENVRSCAPHTCSALFARSEGGRLVPLAFGSTIQVDWQPSIDDDSAWAEAWSSGRPTRRAQMFSGPQEGFAAVIPLRVGVRVIGLLGMERPGSPFTMAELGHAETAVADAALRIETALLFAEVRQIATAEERRRVAREVHDGIAQELASLGYVMDDMAYRATSEEQRQALQSLRADLTRIISELRLSIFDLRSEIHASSGLGAALSDYVRAVGAGSDLTVHLVLDESPHRLRTEAEAEVLRIAQEAITNVRKHARADNLWVTCRIRPPSALLRIEDDGLGLRRSRADSYGMEIMRERARRLGADLTVSEREGGGTVVSMTMGEPEAMPSIESTSPGGAHANDGSAH